MGPVLLLGLCFPAALAQPLLVHSSASGNATQHNVSELLPLSVAAVRAGTDPNHGTFGAGWPDNGWPDDGFYPGGRPLMLGLDMKVLVEDAVQQLLGWLEFGGQDIWGPRTLFVSIDSFEHQWFSDVHSILHSLHAAWTGRVLQDTPSIAIQVGLSGQTTTIKVGSCAATVGDLLFTYAGARASCFSLVANIIDTSGPPRLCTHGMPVGLLDT